MKNLNFSILPIYVIGIFIFCGFITYRAKKNRSITARGALSIYILLLALFIWTLIVIGMGMQGIHVSLIERIPLLWQPFIPILITGIAFLSSQTLRGALRKVASTTPWSWLIFFQGLRISALGGVIKGLKGEITSNFVFWVGIPDFLYGVSAVLLGWLYLKNVVNNRFLFLWNLIGASIILLPVVAFMNYFMNEPGFVFIFQFPMVLAPSIVVPMFILSNLLLAWGIFTVNGKNS